MNAEWIKQQFLDHPEKKQVDLATALGVKPDKISKILAGTRRIQADEVPLIEAFFADNRAAVALPSGRIAGAPAEGLIFDVCGEDFARIPVYDVQFSAGFGANNDAEQVIDYQVMSVATLRRWTKAPISQLTFIRVDGDSMEPLLFNDDWVLIDSSNTNLISPAIYAIVYDGRGFLKHASKNIETGAVTLASHNPLYPPQTITRPEGLRITGRVVMSIRKH